MDQTEQRLGASYITSKDMGTREPLDQEQGASAPPGRDRRVYDQMTSNLLLWRSQQVDPQAWTWPFITHESHGCSSVLWS